MSKRILILLLCARCLFSAEAGFAQTPPRGLFVSLVQDPPVLSSRKALDELLDLAKNTHVRTLFVQIYRENKTWFPSKIADSAPYERSLKEFSEDPFALLIRRAHASGIQVHAWLNLLSLSQNENANLLKKYGTGILTRNLKPKKTLKEYRIDDQYFLEPSDARVRKELSGLVAEILRAYPDLDGIQFDYIRYPDKNPFYGYTPENLERFKKATGRNKADESVAAWKDWRRSQVTEFLEQLVKTVRAIRPGISVSATACAPYSRAYQEAFQDWPSWLRRGLVDFVTLMDYSADFPEFRKNISDARLKAPGLKKVNVGVGAYKLVHSPEKFEEEWGFCEQSGPRACVAFHYGSLCQNPRLADPLLPKKTKKT